MGLAHLVLLLTATRAVPSVRVVVDPVRPLIERRDASQYLSFDFVLANDGKTPLKLTKIEVSVFDKQGKLVLRQFVDQNGYNPGLTTVGRVQLPAGGSIKVFNPFYAFDSTVSLGTLRYRFSFVRERSKAETLANDKRLTIDNDLEVDSEVSPTEYPGKTDLILPLRDRLIVFDGHDFYSHHRRQPFGLPGRPPHNPVRYAYDFVAVDSAGALYAGDPYSADHWFVYGAEIVAPGAGTVVSAANTIPENRFRGRTIEHPKGTGREDPLGLGNHVIIDHGNGEFSYLLHMKTGSVRVQKGDQVRQGQVIGQVGFSGDADIPHLHYMVADGPVGLEVDGLPSYFSRFERVVGSKTQAVARGQIGSGEILRSIVPR